MNWKDITIEKYNQIALLQSEGLSEIDLVAAVVAILDGVTTKEVEEMPYALLLLKARSLRFLQKNPIPSIARKSYELAGTKYIPTLNPVELTTAQYIDFQVRAADAPEDLAGLLSIILVPEGKKYNEGYSSDDVRNVIYKNMGIEDALGLSAFFFILWKKSIAKLLREMKRNCRQLKRAKNRTQEQEKLLSETEKLIITIEQAQKYL